MKIDKSQFQPEGNTQKTPAESTQKPSFRSSKLPDVQPEHLPKIKIACIVLAVLIFVLSIRLIGTYRNLSAEVKDQQDRIERLMAEKEELAGEATNTEDSDTESSADRSETDSQRASTFLKLLLTWDDYDSYTTVRQTLITDYEVTEDSSLLTTFMPNVSEDSLGDANMEFDSAVSYIVSEDDDKISYFAICQVSNSVDGNSGSGQVGVFYTLDEDGTFSDLSAYTLEK